MFQLRLISAVFLLLVTIDSVAHGARILCYFPNPSKSHVLLALPVCEELANRGHDVTTVLNFKHGHKGPNYREIIVPFVGIEPELLQKMISGKMGIGIGGLLKTAGQFVNANIYTIKSKEFQKILKEESFDLIFFVPVFFNNVQLGIADHFNAPYVGLSPMGNIYYMRDLIGSPSFPATVPFKLFDVKQMTFVQRLLNFCITALEVTLTEVMDIKQKWDYEEVWPNAKRSYKEMKRNISVIFYNQHVSQSKIPTPLLPMEVELGGSQIHTKPKPLTSDFQMWMDGAKDGVILWTFGSNVPISMVDSGKVKAILNVLGRLKQRVVMKWELDNIQDLPDNVMARKWLPQNSILAHNNTVLFISHCGAGGGNEAVYHRVPILGIPFFGDQPTNLKKYEEEGWARGMTLDEVTEETFGEAVNDLLTNPKYRDKVTELSDVYRDRLATPLDTAVYWVEYVIKHHGAPFLSYPGKELNFIQTYCLDVIAVILLVLYILKRLVVGTVKFVFKKAFSCLKSKHLTAKQQKQTKTKKQQ